MLHFQIYTRIFKINIFRQFAALERYCDCSVLAHPPSSGYECGSSACVLQSCSVIYCTVVKREYCILLRMGCLFYTRSTCISPVRHRVLHISTPIYSYLQTIVPTLPHNTDPIIWHKMHAIRTDTNQLQQHIAKYVFIQFAF